MLVVGGGLVERRAGAPTQASPSARVCGARATASEHQPGRTVQAAQGCVLVGFAVGVPQRRRFQRVLRRRACVEPSEATVVLQEAEDEVVEDRPQQKPWLQRHLPHGRESSEDLLLHFMQALEERGVQLYEAQEEAIVEIFSGAHVVLDTPTGSGKSLVAVAALFKALAEGGKAYYTSPTKALTSEKFFDLCRHFGPASVGMATGDISLNQRAPLICCTAEVLASISLHEGQASGITTVVMDEFHYFADPDRGSAWEVPLWRMTGPGSSTTFLLMSGTLGANDSLYRTLQRRSGRPVRVVSSQDLGG
ncbi:helY [Symbiodinium sp. CCMP2592]|nr:helY [Symbiodinium sp. CCMP2592]